MKPIPIAAAQRIAAAYGYDQVVVIARKVGPDGGEHVTTYGVDQQHCTVAARVGDHLKHNVMGWPRPADEKPPIRLVRRISHDERRRLRATVMRLVGSMNPILTPTGGGFAVHAWSRAGADKIQNELARSKRLWCQRNILDSRIVLVRYKTKDD